MPALRVLFDVHVHVYSYAVITGSPVAALMCSAQLTSLVLCSSSRV